MQQSRLASLIEALMNTAIGFVLSLIVGHFVLPKYGCTPGLAVNVEITMIYTIVSIARGYVIRRWFNARLHHQAQLIAERIAS